MYGNSQDVANQIAIQSAYGYRRHAAFIASLSATNPGQFGYLTEPDLQQENSCLRQERDEAREEAASLRDEVDALKRTVKWYEVGFSPDLDFPNEWEDYDFSPN